MRTNHSVRVGLLALFLLTAVACGTRPPSRPFSEKLPELQGRNLTLVTYKRPILEVRTLGKVFAFSLAMGLGAPGIAAGAALGNVSNGDVLAKLSDPALALADVVTEKSAPLFNYQGLERVSDAQAYFRSIDGLNDHAARGGLVIDVTTDYWRLIFIRSAPSRFTLDYQARVRVFDADKRTVLKQAWCYFISDSDPKTAPTWEELMADDGALLHKLQDEGVAKCGEQLMSDLIS